MSWVGVGWLSPVSLHQAQGARLWGAITRPHLIHPPSSGSFLQPHLNPPQPAAHSLEGSGAQAEGQKAVLSQEEEPGSLLLAGSAMR